MSLTIMNFVLGKEIVFNNSPQIFVHPHDYDDDPYMEIKIVSNFNFLVHSRNCDDCGAFVKDFGSDSLNWFIFYNNKKYRLDMSAVGGKSRNTISFKVSQDECGSTMKLSFSKIPVEIEELEKLRESLVRSEDYEKACQIRDLINLEKEQ